MEDYWIEFEDGEAGFCNGANEYDAKRIAKHFRNKEVKEAWKLPYPAMPIIWQFDHPVYGKCPPFCFQPKSCKGLGSCPRRIACSE